MPRARVQDAGGTPTKAPGESPPSNGWTAGRRMVVVSVIMGVVIRLMCVVLAPAYSYLNDHLDYMAWAEYAYHRGPLHLYEFRRGLWVNVRIHRPNRGFHWVPRRVPHACNYPPAACYVFWMQGGVWHWLDDGLVESRLPARGDSSQPADSSGAMTVRSRRMNTITARFVNALPGILADFLMAWGVAAAVRRLKPGPGSDVASAFAFTVAVLAPPVWLDSSLWNQTDSWVACLLVWCLWGLLSERYSLAGVLYGTALMTKAQALLFAPVLVFVFLSLRLMPEGSWHRALTMLRRTGLGALGAVVVLAGPFFLSSPSAANRPSWFQRSYVEPIAQSYPRTTLKSFNVWWLDYARHAGERDALDPQARIWGVSKDAAGKAALLLAVLVSGALCARRWRWDRPAWVAFALLTAYMAFLLPTRVHERYLFYCMPFLIIAAASARIWIPPLVAVLVVGTAEMTSYMWCTHLSVSPVARHASLVFSLLSVAVGVYVLIVLLPRPWPTRPERRS